MSLSEGTRLGSYEITGQIGAGGMGEVYRATDTKLGRDVAIKTLPAALAADADRLVRFEREAKLLASLNHPHIASIHSLDEYQGTLYLAMELIEGETLEEKLKPGALPVEDALRLMLQIAEALEAAHGKGVIHRDLKPANVMVTSEGIVKVLDFGLAKAFSEDRKEASAAQSPALSVAMTQQGLVLGTAGYMSPEQASGQATDQRADIWALGVVLYEMLTGLPPFSGESVPHILADVLKTEPDWNRLPKNLHWRVRQMLMRCLAKKPRNRLHSIADARIEIEETLSDPVGLFATSPVSEAISHSTLAQRSTLTRLFAGSALVVLGALATLLIGVFTQTPQDAQEVSRLLMMPMGEESPRLATYGRSIAISPDGRRVAYLGAGGALLVRGLDEIESATLVPPGDLAPAESPFFSPDGRRIGYFAQNLGVYSVDVQGGPRSLVIDLSFDDGSPGGATWGDDDTLVFATLNRSAGLYRLASGSTEVEPLTTPDADNGEADHLWPEYLPGDRAVLFTVTAASGRDGDAQVAVLDLDTEEYHTIVPSGSHAHYVRSGHLTYVAAGQLRVIPFALDRLETTGPSFPVERDQTVRISTSLAGEFDVADNGTLIYLANDENSIGGPTGNRRLIWLNREQEIEPLEIEPRAYLYPRISEDGNRVLLDIRERDNDIWLLDLLRENLLTNQSRNSGLDRFPLWQDDQHFIFVRNQDGQAATEYAIFRQRIDDPTSAEQLSDPWPTQQTPNAVTPDGSQLVFDRDGDLFLLELDGSRQVTPLLETPFLESRSALSADGGWIAFHREQSDGRMEVIVREFPIVGDGREIVVSGATGGTQPWWSPSGQELFFFAPTGEVMSIPIGPDGDWSDSRPDIALDANHFTFAGIAAAAPTFDISDDGRRFLVVQELSGGTPQPVTVVQNWFSELGRLGQTN